MARIFRALLIAAANAIKEFFAFATDNGESQVGDSVKLNDGMATSNYDWSAYPSNTAITGDYTQTGTIEKVKQIGNDFVYGMQEPEQDNKEVQIKTGKVYYAYTNENEQSVYATDDPIKNHEMQNALVIGTLVNNSNIYSGFSDSNYIKLNNIPALCELVFKITLGSNVSKRQLLVSTTNLIELDVDSGYLKTYNFQTGGDLYNICSIQSNGTYWVKIIIKENIKEYYYSTNGTDYILGLTAQDNLHSQETIYIGKHVTVNGYAYLGSIDMNNTYFDYNGAKTYFISVASTLYDDTFTALSPQPEFEIDGTNIIIDNVDYIKTPENNLIQDIESNISIIDNTTIHNVVVSTDINNAIIKTSANITTSNNDTVITDGSYHIFNLTVPADKTAYIQSGGIEYQTNDMPLLVKSDRGVTLLLKEGNNSHYLNHWVLTRDYNLHYQEIQFSTNVDNPTILVKINNVVTEPPYYAYANDTYYYKISKEGYCDYEGTGKIVFNTKDGNIVLITASLTPMTGTVETGDYTYTIDNTGNMILTGYTGTNGDTTVPNIDEI